MSPLEERVRELAYQIWESEGQPVGHEYRHWEMACKLAETQHDAIDEKITGNIPSVIAPEEAIPDSASTTDVTHLPAEESTFSIRPDVSLHIRNTAELEFPEDVASLAPKYPDSQLTKPPKSKQKKGFYIVARETRKT